jgi:ubiquinone/menaquinone biosynthesis C-methylase UbiE
MRLVEIEAGAGGLTLALGQAVGPEGAVIATDHRPAVVANLGLTALEHGLAHVTVSPLPVGSLPPAASGSDGVILTAAFNSLPDKQAFVLEVYRALRPGGMLAISELITDPDYCLASTVVTYLVLAGFVIERETDSLTGYTVIGRKPA